MIKVNEAFVVGKYDYSETSLIVLFLTKDEGLIKTIAKGAKRKKSQFKGLLDYLNFLKIYYIKKENRELQTLTNVDLLESNIELFSKSENFDYLFAITKIITKGVKENQKEEEIFRLLKAILNSLKKGVPPDWAFYYFLIWFLRLSGFFPSYFFCSNCGKRGEIYGFDLKRGGFYCSKCKEENTQKIGEESLRIIREFFKNNPGYLVEKVGIEFPIELKNMLYLNLLEHFEIKL